MGKNSSGSVRREVDDSVTTQNLHLVVGIDGGQYLVQIFVVGEIGEIAGLCERLVEDDDVRAEQTFEVRSDVAHAQVEEVDGPVVGKGLEMSGPERREVYVARGAVVLHHVAGLHHQLLPAGFGVDVESDGAFDQQDFDTVGIRVGFEVEPGSQDADSDLARLDDERFAGIFRYVGEYFALDEDTALLAREDRRIGDAAAGIQVQLRAVGKRQGGDFAIGNLLFEPFHLRLAVGIEQSDGAQQRNDEHGGDTLAPCDDTRTARGCGRLSSGDPEPVGDTSESRTGRRVVVDVQAVEKLGQLCLRIRVVTVFGEPHLDFELLLRGEFIVEIFV